jgi:hypothetical protein
MNTLEDRLTAALRETGEEITRGSVPPLALDTPRRRPRVPGNASRRRWATRLTPLAAAAAVAAVVAASLAISATFHGPVQGRGSAAGPSRGAPPGGPAALRKVPPYYVSLTPGNNTYILGGRLAEVRATATGTVLATIRPPRPFGAFTWVSGASDDRTFILAAQRYWTILPGNRGAKAQERDDTTPTRFFELSFTPSTHTARLTELAIPGKVSTQQLAGVALSPDGTKLALDFRRSIQVITLATGAKREWLWPRGGWVGNFKPYGQVLSWTADGRKLAFQQWGGKFDNTAHVRVLDTTQPGSRLLAAKLVVSFPNKLGALTLEPGSDNALITPDGSKIVVGTMTQARKSYATTMAITEFSARTGNIEHSMDQFRFDSPACCQVVLWSDSSGAVLIVSDPRGKAQAGTVGAVIGVLTGNRFTALPRAPLTNQIAW